MAGPAYRRLEVKERRRQLLERGAELFTRYSYDELSMRKIAREAGISKALLYHYFPSKQAFFQATLAQAAEELRARTEPDAKPARHSSEPRVSLIDAAGSIAAARHRDQIADDLIEMAQGRTGGAGLFMVRGQNAIGWRGLGGNGRPVVGAAIENLVVPLGGSSVLQVAYDTQRAFHGPSPAAGRPVERQLWLALGVAEPPSDMLVVPILVGRRVVNLLYAHGPGGRSIAEPHTRELIDLCQAAGAAYVRLIQASRIDKPAG